MQQSSLGNPVAHGLDAAVTRSSAWVCGRVATALLISLLSVGCAQRPLSESMRLLDARALVVSPITNVADWTFDNQADGLSVIVQPRDHFGEPLKAAGQFRFELFTYRLASVDRRGERIGVWTLGIDSDARQKQHWDIALQAYRFQLATPQRFEPQTKYLLLVVYGSPFGERTMVEHVIEVQPNVTGDGPALLPAR